MAETPVSVMIVEDERLAAETLADWLRSRSGFLAEDAEVEWYDRLELVHERLLDDFTPTWAFVDIQLRSDRTGGLRVLELLHGLSPTTRVVVVSIEARVPELRDRLARWPFVRGVVAKGRITEELPTVLEGSSAAERGSAAGNAEKPQVVISAAVEGAARAIGLDLTKLVRAAFPLDERVRVVNATSGLSPAAGFGVLVTSSTGWRSHNAYYFLKAATGDDGERLLRREFRNYLQLSHELLRGGASASKPREQGENGLVSRSRSSAPDWIPRCYGLVKADETWALVFEYVGVVEEKSIVPEHWKPTHLDGLLLERRGDVDALDNIAALGEAFSPLGALLRLPSAGGHWPGDDRRESVDALCTKAAGRMEARLGDYFAAKGDAGGGASPLAEPRLELEECALVGRSSIPNPVYHLSGLDSLDREKSVMSLGHTHGDLHCENLVRRSGGGESRWMLIDFGHAEGQNLQLLDAARLECDLVLEKMPLLPLPAAFELAEGLLRDLREPAADSDGERAPPKAVRLQADPDGERQSRVEHLRFAVRQLRGSMIRGWGERVRAVPGAGELPFKRQYLYALLYESVRWLTHRAGLLRFLHRLFYGALVCETLLPELVQRPTPTGHNGRGE